MAEPVDRGCELGAREPQRPEVVCQRRDTLSEPGPIGDLLESEAVLVGNPASLAGRAEAIARLDTMLGAVLAGRRRKYVMMNAPSDRLAALEALLPGLESPSVIPLAHPGMIAIHAVVGSDDVWALLPRLKATGASGILVLPIEKLIA